MEKNKKLERVKDTLNFLSDNLRFNEVHANSYKNKQGKLRYKGSLRVHEQEFTFEEMSLNDLDNMLCGILIGYLFCRIKNEYKK